MRRPLLDLGSQILPVASQLIERIFLTGLLLHRLGVNQFERWSLISATVTLLTMVDLGTQITFSNRMSRAAHRGDIDEAVAIFRQSNSIFALLGMIVLGATIAVATIAPLQVWLGMVPTLAPNERWVTLCLGGAIAVKLAMTNASGAYRANLAFGRGTFVTTMADVIRIGAGIAALLLFGSMLSLAVAMVAGTILAFVVIVPLDLARRYPGYRWQWQRPMPLTTRHTIRESLMFGTSFLPSIVLTQVPIMIIGARGASGVLAGYVLSRTIANMVRTLAQKVTFIAGMELSRLESQARLVELDAGYRRLSSVMAIAFGIGCALLWSWGALLLRVWTGSTTLYDPLLLAVMLAPLVLIPGTQINLPLLTYGHRPESFALAVIAQTVAAALMALFLPIESIALRLSMALTLAEILFMAPVIALATRRMIGPAAAQVALPNLLWATGAAGGTLLLSRAGQQVSPGIPGLALALVLTAAVGVPVLFVKTRRLLRIREMAGA